MKIVPASLLALLLATSACAGQDAAGSGSGDKSDDIGLDEVPKIAGSYGYVVTSAISSCETAENGDSCISADRNTIQMTVRGVATISQDGTLADATFSACRVNVTTDEKSYDETEYLKDGNTLRSLGEVARFEGSFGTGDDGPVLHSGLMALLLGAELSDPVGEDFPTDKRDARAIDQDGDGDPGISLNAPIGRVFLGARLVMEMELSATEDGSLQGSIEQAGFDYAVYDDTIPFVNAKKKVDAALSTVGIDSQEHQITFVPGLSDCDAVLSAL